MKITCVLPMWLALVASASATVTLDWVTVGDPGNAADSTGYGAVGYSYQISKYEVTNAQYAEFLNAAAATDTNALYNSSMGTDARGGITRSGSSGSYTYSVKAGYADMPVVFVSHLDAQRFSNWMHNGQGSGSTETGAYTVGNLAIHSSNASVWIPTEDEWYKAAYYDPTKGGTGGYWLYPTQSDTPPVSAMPGGTGSDGTNVANYRYNDGIANGINGGYAVTQSTSLISAQNYLSDVGAYSNSSSYYGTFDQGGNVWEWNDAVIGSVRGSRGGSWVSDESVLRSSFRSSNAPTGESSGVGFRLASSSVPEPSRALLLLAGACAIFMRRRRVPLAL